MFHILLHRRGALELVFAFFLCFMRIGWHLFLLVSLSRSSIHVALFILDQEIERSLFWNILYGCRALFRMLLFLESYCFHARHWNCALLQLWNLVWIIKMTLCLRRAFGSALRRDVYTRRVIDSFHILRLLLLLLTLVNYFFYFFLFYNFKKEFYFCFFFWKCWCYICIFGEYFDFLIVGKNKLVRFFKNVFALKNWNLEKEENKNEMFVRFLLPKKVFYNKYFFYIWNFFRDKKIINSK